MVRSLTVLTVCAMLASCATVPAATEQKLQVEQASDQFTSTRIRGDVAAFAGSFTEDGMFMVPGVQDATGRAAVRDLAQRRFAGATIEDFKIHRREIDVAGDSAYELAWYSEIDRRKDQAFRMEGRYFILWSRSSDNVWRVQRFLYSFSDAAPLP
ncbi:MAG TPA: DUF4440 domain-containing protein [Thermoanaerobaculia bacterium]